MSSGDARALHHERTALVAAAWSEIAAHGPGVTTEQIAEAAQLPAERLQHHFPTPQDLLIGVADEYYARVMALCLTHTDGWDTPEQAAATWRHFVHSLTDLGIGDVAAHITPDALSRVGHGFYAAMIPRQQRLTREINAILRRASSHRLITGNVTGPSFLMGVSTISRPVPQLPETMNRRHRGWMTDIYLRGMRPE